MLHSRHPALLVAASVAIAGGATALFLAPWWNRFLGLTLDGCFPLYGHLIRTGLVPYRDFFLHLPPLQALLDGGLEAIFGPSLYATRLFGAALRVLLAVLLALWLSRAVRPTTALLASLASVWLASGDDTDILDLYNHHALLLAIASGYFACRALDGGRRARLWWLLSGLAAGLTLATKQTIGLGATLAVPVAVVALAVGDGDFRRARRGLAGFALGWSLPVTTIAAWLGANDALEACLRNVFFAAAGSKGSPIELLSRVWIDPFFVPELARPARYGLVAALLLALSVRPPGAPFGEASRRWRGLLGAALLVLATLAAGLAIANRELLDPVRLREAQRFGVFMAQFAIAALAVLLVQAAARRRLVTAERDALVLALVGWTAAAAVAFSWPAGEAIALPSLAAVVAWALEGRPRHRLAGPLRVPSLALAGYATVAVLALKLLVPFAFAQWVEPPVRRSIKQAELSQLRGLRFSPRSVDTVQQVTRAIQANSRPDEPIFVFSAMPIFYWLAERRPATYAALHWFDVTPDSVVIADRRLLAADPPPVIVWQWLPRAMVVRHEGYFRHSRRSALRLMRNRVAKLLARRYVLVQRHSVYGGAQPLEVWVRKDRHAGARGPAGRSGAGVVRGERRYRTSSSLSFGG